MESSIQNKFKRIPFCIPSEKIIQRKSRVNWLSFITPEEMKQIATLSSYEIQYQRIKNNCLMRYYRNNPKEFSLIISNKQKVSKKKLLISSMASMIKSIDSIPEEKGMGRKPIDEGYKLVNTSLKREGLIDLSPKNKERKLDIIKLVKEYKTAKDFRREHLREYSWLGENGIRDEILGHFPDYSRRQKYKVEKDDAYNKEVAILRKAQRNAAKCFDEKEFSKRFPTSYNYVTNMNILDEIKTHFKSQL